MTNNIKKDKDQHNDSIENEPRFDSSFILHSGTKDPLSVVTVSLQGGNKRRSTRDAGLILLIYTDQENQR